MNSNPTVSEEKLTTSNPNRKGRFIEKYNITPHSPDDGSAEPKRYSVDFVFSINLPLSIRLTCQFFFIYIYIYI